jgi:uncharacterized protein (TIGR02145 family)
MKKGLSLIAISLLSVTLLFQGCKKATVPELATSSVTEITINSAVSGGTITSDGGEEITEKGVCWSTSADPTIADSRTSDGTGSANFTSNLVGLAEGTLYYVKAYATNSVGTAYGNEVTFTTSQVTGAVLTTTEATNITSTTATSGGNITDAGGGAISARGICWSTNPNPTTLDEITVNGTGTGTFSSSMTGLTDGTTYYYRAYATNSSGTTYGSEYSFLTPVTDIEGNVYKTVVIGNQIWMAENLKVTKFNNDADILNVTDATEWSEQTGPAYCWYNNDQEYNKPIYGALYNWFAASSANLCPTGWHVPTDLEYNTLEIGLGLPEADVDVWGWRGTDHGSKMKNTAGWNAGENGTNTSGFTALPAGYRYYLDGLFAGQNTISYFWTSTQHDADRGWYRRLDGNNTAVYKASTNKEAGKSIRCLKD